MSAIFTSGQNVVITDGKGGHLNGVVSRVWDMSRKSGPQIYTVIVYGDSRYRTYVRTESSVTPR